MTNWIRYPPETIIIMSTIIIVIIITVIIIIIIIIVIVIIIIIKDSTLLRPLPFLPLPSNLTQNPARKTKQTTRTHDLQRRQLGIEFHAAPIPKLHGGEGIEAVGGERLRGFHGGGEAQGGGELGAEDSDEGCEQGRVLGRGGGEREQEGADGFRVFVVV
jgi:hypothetical protein